MASQTLSSAKNFCSTCQIQFNSEAELAIHEFSRKHCDNLLRSSRNKPPVKPKVAKPAPPLPPDDNKNATAVIEPAASLNISLYGYFDPSQPIVEPVKEFNTEYDPYLQKLAENPAKEMPILPTTNITSFSRSKKKKKRTCGICNVDCLNIPEYDAHMKSAKHVYKLRMSGMGVSAHFVKAGTDLHTTDKLAGATSDGDEEGASQEELSQTDAEDKVPVAPVELYCDVCQLLLNSVAQYTAHVAGKTHNDNLKRKKKKEPAKPVPNQLYCYSCNLSLNNICQYNAHKTGKKHQTKCRILIRQGYTIPPDERLADQPWMMGPKPGYQGVVRYPEAYQEHLDKQNKVEATKLMPPPASRSIGPVQPPAPPAKPVLPPIDSVTGMHHCPHCSERFATSSKLEIHVKTHKDITAVVETPPEKKALKRKMEVSKESEGFKCTICDERFKRQPSFEVHLNSEEHGLKILEVKRGGTNSKEIHDKVMADRKVIRQDWYGHYCCGICAVITTGDSEMEQHLSSLVHKYAERDYSKKRLIEIQQCVNKSEDGQFHCRLCKKPFSQIILFNAHLHGTEHKSLFMKDQVSKNNSQRWLWLPGQRYRSAWSEPRNPGFRTKIGGMVKDLKSGIVYPVPNLETIEPRIDKVKNVAIGVTGTHAMGKKKNLLKIPRLIASRRLPGMLYKGHMPPGGPQGGSPGNAYRQLRPRPFQETYESFAAKVLNIPPRVKDPYKGALRPSPPRPPRPLRSFIGPEQPASLRGSYPPRQVLRARSPMPGYGRPPTRFRPYPPGPPRSPTPYPSEYDFNMSGYGYPPRPQYPRPAHGWPW